MGILFYAAGTVTLPHLLVGWLFLRRPPSRVVGLAEVLLVGTVVVVFFLAGAWAFSSFYLRYFLLAAFLASAGVSLVRARTAPFHRGSRDRALLLRRIILGAVAVALVAGALRGRSSRRQPVDLAFPMGAGTYCVLQGGSNLVTNPFHTLVGSHFALDIVKLRSWGNRADSLLPRELDDYAIFGEPVLSPCNGTVLAATDGHPDMAASDEDFAPLGNHVSIRCEGGVRALLAHLRERSVAVSAGEALTQGERIGEVGNSGLSGEPHLHIQAVLEAGAAPDGREAPIPIRFRGHVLSTNDRVTIEERSSGSVSGPATHR